MLIMQLHTDQSHYIFVQSNVVQYNNSAMNSTF